MKKRVLLIQWTIFSVFKNNDNCYFYPLLLTVAHKGFPIAQSVLTYLQKRLNPKILSVDLRLESSEVKVLREYLKGLKIRYVDPRTRGVRSFRRVAVSDKDPRYAK